MYVKEHGDFDTAFAISAMLLNEASYVLAAYCNRFQNDYICPENIKSQI